MPVIHMIRVDQIDRPPASKRFDRMSNTTLVGAVADLGKRITVRWVPRTNRYDLILGEHQWATARKERAELIEATVLNVAGDHRAWRLLQAVGRQVGTPDVTPLEEARLFDHLVEAGFTPRQIADHCGKFPTYIRWRIELLDLCPAGQTALSKGRLPVGLAWYISRLSRARQVAFLNDWLRGEYPGAIAAQDAARTLRLAS